jgi:hypothetical protein
LWLVALGRLAFEAGNLAEAERHVRASLRIARPREHHLTIFRAEWLGHRIARARDPGDPDRHRLSYLRKLYRKVQEHQGVREVQEFQSTELAASNGTRS